MSDEELAVQEDESKTDDEMSEDEKLMAKLTEAVTVEKEDLGGLRMKLTVTVPRETIDERMDDQFAELKREALVPGFRKGHAPMKLIEKRFGANIGDDLKGKLLGSGYLAAVKKEDLKPLGDPLVWVQAREERIGENNVSKMVEVEKLVELEAALDHISLPKEGAFTFACEIELRPEFELPKLAKIPVQKPDIVISKENVDEEILKLRQYRGKLEPVEEGGVEADDLLYAALKMSVDGEVIAQEDNLDMPARDFHLRGVYLDGFGKAVLGKQRDEEFTFTATVPEDHEDASLRGKKATFDLKILEIKRLVLPELDEVFFLSIGVESEKDLRKTIKANLEAGADRVAARRMEEQVGDYLIANTKIDIPEGLSARQAERSVSRRMMEMRQAGMPPSQIAKAADQLRVSAREQVVRDLKLFFMLERIGDDLGVEVSKEEINGAIAEIAARTGKRFDRVRDELSKQDGLSVLYLRLREEKVLRKLVEDADVTEAKPGKKVTSGKSLRKKSGGPTAKQKVGKSAVAKRAKTPAAKRKKSAGKKGGK